MQELLLIANTHFADITQSEFIVTIVKLTAYIVPFFLIPAAFKAGMGAFSALTGMLSDRSRGLFDRQRKYRQGQFGKNWQGIKTGTRYNPNSKAAKYLGGKALNRAGSHLGAGIRGRYGFGKTGAVTRANNMLSTADDMARENSMFKAQMNNEDAMAAHALGNNRARLASLQHFQKTDEATGRTVADEAKITNAIAASQSIKMDARTKTAAADALAKSGKVLGNREEAAMLYAVASGSDRSLLNTIRGNDELSGGNSSLQKAIEGQYQFTSRQVGRADIGRNSDRASLQELSMSEMSRQKPKSLENLFGGGDLAGVGSPVDMPIMRAMRESSGYEQQHYADILFAAQHNPYTTPEQQKHIANAIEYAEQNFNDRMNNARNNYRNKMNGPNTGTPGAAGGGAPGSPAGP